MHLELEAAVHGRMRAFQRQSVVPDVQERTHLDMQKVRRFVVAFAVAFVPAWHGCGRTCLVALE